MKDKIILTDADGVLLDWSDGFQNWMHAEGYRMTFGHQKEYKMSDKFGVGETRAEKLVNVFNNSDYIEHLPPHIDSVKYVKLLAEEGYRFVVITSMGGDEHAKGLRWNNLRDLFGDVFDALHILEIHTSKEDILSAYDSAIWIEDSAKNADSGIATGHKTYLIDALYNQDDDVHEDVIRVKNWSEIYKNIIINTHVNKT